MEIRFSHGRAYPEDAVQAAASHAGCYASIKWATATQVRFQLKAGPGSGVPATEAQHDDVIRALLTIDPDAVIRTARAVYEGLNDFQSQHDARMALKSE